MREMSGKKLWELVKYYPKTSIALSAGIFGGYQIYGAANYIQEFKRLAKEIENDKKMFLQLVILKQFLGRLINYD